MYIGIRVGIKRNVILLIFDSEYMSENLLQTRLIVVDNNGHGKFINNILYILTQFEKKSYHS